jgi:uncharacterized protein involved in response to NO
VNRSLPLHGELGAPGKPARYAVASKGFRPFFLLAAAFASAIVPIWLFVLFGVLRPTTYLDATSWHAHEMIFGFVVAVIAGFLLTAVGNWTQRETAVGGKLLGLCAVWALGRLAMSFPSVLPRGIPALIDLAFLPLLAFVLARPLLAARNRRNFVMLGILAALFATNAVVHLDALGFVPVGSAHRALVVAIDVVILLCLVILGRILPMFTRNATGEVVVEAPPSIEALTVASMAALTTIDVFVADSAVARIVAAWVGALAAVRAARWGTRHTGRHPLLWILHAGYAWIIVGLVLRTLPLLGSATTTSSATHALTVGAIGSLTLGMMARVALGHTGRPLEASRAMTIAFVLVSLGTVARVFGPLVAPASHAFALWIAGAAWTGAFAIYVVVYAPILTSPRADGKPG